MIPMLFLMSAIVFLMAHAAPGDPLQGLLDPTIKPEFFAEMRHRLGLDQPLYIQYWYWLQRMIEGNFGYSMRYGTAVSTMIAQRIGNTVELYLVSHVIALLIGLPIGIWVARRPQSKLDYGVTGASFLGLSTPSFFWGLILIYIFAIKLGWLPAVGTVSTTGYAGIGDRIQHLILPAFTLAIIDIATYMRFMRSSTLETLRMDFVRTARAKGLKEGAVMFRHVLRNAIMPIVTLLGLNLGSVLSGAIITETMFSWPGLGQLGFNAVLDRDYPVIMAVNLMAACAIMVGNLLADATYAWVDPRIRYD